MGLGVKRGEVWLVHLDPTVGREVRKTRPCLIVTPDSMGHHGTHLIVPLTSGGRPARFRPLSSFGGRDGRLLLDQMRAVSHERLSRRLGVIDPATLSETLRLLRWMFTD